MSVSKLTIVDDSLIEEHGSDVGAYDHPLWPRRPDNTTLALTSVVTRPHHGHAVAPACHTPTGAPTAWHIDGEGACRGSLDPTMGW